MGSSVTSEQKIINFDSVLNLQTKPGSLIHLGHSPPPPPPQKPPRITDHGSMEVGGGMFLKYITVTALLRCLVYSCYHSYTGV